MSITITILCIILALMLGGAVHNEYHKPQFANRDLLILHKEIERGKLERQTAKRRHRKTKHMDRWLAREMAKLIRLELEQPVLWSRDAMEVYDSRQWTGAA